MLTYRPVPGLYWVFELGRARYAASLRCVTVREKAQWLLQGQKWPTYCD
jgi:hypothetical protein